MDSDHLHPAARGSVFSRLRHELDAIEQLRLRTQASAAPPQPEIAARVAAMEGQIEALRAAVDQSDSEIDALQIAAARAARPWYQDPTVMVAVVALVFSAGTWAVSARREVAQDRQRARTELTGFIQRLSALPRDNFELSQKYGQVAGTQLSSMINAENSLLARQAAGLIDRHPEVASALEMYVVAGALNSSGFSADAQRLYTRAIDASQTFNDELTARRGMAGVLMALGDTAGARRQMRLALSLRSKYPENPAWYFNWNDHQTDVMWAGLEAAAGNCQGAATRLDEASRLLAVLPQGAWLEPYRMQVDSLRLRNGGCRS